MNISYEFKVMYLDEEFDNNFTLKDTSELKETGTIKIVQSNSTSNPTADSPDKAIHDEHDHVESEDQGKENQSQRINMWRPLQR